MAGRGFFRGAVQFNEPVSPDPGRFSNKLGCGSIACITEQLCQNRYVLGGR